MAEVTKPKHSWGNTALTILVVDFVTKRIVLAEVDTFMRGIPLIDGILRFTYVRNAGAAFGMLQGARWPFVAVSTIAVVGLFFLLARGKAHGLRRVAYSLILAGAAGNLIDRVFYGGLVVDFIEMRWQEHVFPVYNVADMGVSIGAALLVISMLREKEDPVASAPSGPLENPVDAPRAREDLEEAGDGSVDDRSRADGHA